MAKVRKRKDRDGWEADYLDHRRKRKRKFAKTRAEAEELLADGIKEAKKAHPEIDSDMTTHGVCRRVVGRRRG